MSGNLHMAWARLFVESLRDAGIGRIVVSPGSRSTPLALAAHQMERLSVEVAVDERSAAFFALGLARASREPVALLCTSGTAPAHYFPAIVEASESFLPLIAITADRPWEAHGNASAQTTDQARLFGVHARAYLELGLPDPDPAALRACRRVAAQAAATACGPIPGPVQVNAGFRKPLEPVPVPGTRTEGWEAAMAAVRARPTPRAVRVPGTLAAEVVHRVERLVLRARRGVVVAGPALGFAADADAVRALAAASGFPVLAEATSGVRFGACAPYAVGAFDAIVRAGAFEETADLVLQVGGAPVSPALAGWLARSTGSRIVVAPFGWNDPDDLATELVMTDPGTFARSLAERLAERPEPADAAWVERWRKMDDRAWSALDEARPELGEPDVARAVVDALPARAFLLLGNGRPVRDVDSYVRPSPAGIHVLHQRGVSGIDGLLAGAAGSARALGTPGALLCGDVAFAHDLGSLALLRDVRTPLAIVVVDNGGGRIFDELPIASVPGLDEARARLFHTAPNLDIAAVASAFGVAAADVHTTVDLRRALAAALAHPGATVLRARVPHDGVPRVDAAARIARALRGEAP